MTDGNKDRPNNITDSLANRTLIVTTILVSRLSGIQALMHTPALDFEEFFSSHFHANNFVCKCLF